MFKRILTLLLVAGLLFTSVPIYAKDYATITQKEGVPFYAGLEWQLIDRQTLAAATQSVSFTGLTGNTDLTYQVIGFIKSGAANSLIKIRFNNDTTDANYGLQNISGTNSTAAAARVTNNCYLNSTNTASGNYAFFEAIIAAKSGVNRTIISKCATEISTTTVTAVTLAGAVWNNSADEVTRIDVDSGVASGLGIGSDIFLFVRRQLGSEASAGKQYGKVNVKGITNIGTWQLAYSNTLAAPAASVTIPTLTGNTAVLYRLKCRFVDKTTTGGYYMLINADATTYGYQKITGADTTVAAVRDTSEAQIDLGYTNTDGNICMSDTLLYANAGNIRLLLSTTAEGIATTTVTTTKLIGQSYDNTTDEVTSLVIGALNDNMGIGTNIELWALRLSN